MYPLHASSERGQSKSCGVNSITLYSAINHAFILFWTHRNFVSSDAPSCDSKVFMDSGSRAWRTMDDVATWIVGQMASAPLLAFPESIDLIPRPLTFTRSAFGEGVGRAYGIIHVTGSRDRQKYETVDDTYPDPADHQS